MSWTEREYRRAIELGIPVLTFIREKKFVPGDQVDTDKKAKRLTELISEVGNKRIREMWTTEADLVSKVGMALLKAIGEDESEGPMRPGWYRGSQLPSRETMEELARLSSENRALREDNDRLKALTAVAKEEATFALDILDATGAPLSEVTFARVLRQSPESAAGVYTDLDFVAPGGSLISPEKKNCARSSHRPVPVRRGKDGCCS